MLARRGVHKEDRRYVSAADGILLVKLMKWFDVHSVSRSNISGRAKETVSEPRNFPLCKHIGMCLSIMLVAG